MRFGCVCCCADAQRLSVAAHDAAVGARSRSRGRFDLSPGDDYRSFPKLPILERENCPLKTGKVFSICKTR
jgi:hypothetical protein